MSDMRSNNLEELTKFGRDSLEFTKVEFPEFVPYIETSKYYRKGWSAEIPWHDGWKSIGIIVSIVDWNDQEVLRIDFGNTHEELFPSAYKSEEMLLEEASNIISKMLNEQIVLIAKWITPNEYIASWEEPNYSPKNDEIIQKVNSIWMRSWKGTYNKEWNY